MSSVDEFVGSGPLPQRAALRAVLAVGRRPRGRHLLKQLPQLDQLVGSLLAMERFDDPATSRALGWDPVAIVARGQALRRAEGRL